GPRARWAAIPFALAAVGDVWIGRLAFALGLCFALAAVLALAGGSSRGRVAAAALLAAMCAAASPVAGVPLALAALSESLWRGAPIALPALAFVLWAVWAGWGPARETLAVAGSAATNGAYYAPVERFLDAHARGPVRLEVPLTRTHWETAELAPRVSLARGWE